MSSNIALIVLLSTFFVVTYQYGKRKEKNGYADDNADNVHVYIRNDRIIAQIHPAFFLARGAFSRGNRRAISACGNADKTVGSHAIPISKLIDRL